LKSAGIVVPSGSWWPPLIASSHDDTVVTIESLSKLLFPSLRIGYIAARGAAMQALYAAKLRADTFTTTVAQRSLVRFLESKAADRHQRAAGFLYRRRRGALMTALRRVVERYQPGLLVYAGDDVGDALLQFGRQRRVRRKGSARGP